MNAEQHPGFAQFAVGDTASFTHTIERAGYDSFARLSADHNPLHHDADHARGTEFKLPIAPLHLTMAPLSKIAGMIFPGEPSLYLGHEIQAAMPVYYGDALTYSAQLVGINAALRVLTIRVIVLREIEVVLHGTMRVQATREYWDTPPAEPIRRASDPGTALITGATGAIATATALLLARRGFRLLLQDRGDKPKRAALDAALRESGADPRHWSFVTADLASTGGIAELATAVGGVEGLAAFVHCASAPVMGGLNDLVMTNFKALQQVCDAALPAMLAQQRGMIVLIGSTASLSHIEGWDDYSAAKAMATNYITGFDQKFRSVGVRGRALLPGYVATGFSQGLRGPADALEAGEVAEQVATAIATPAEEWNIMVMKAGSGSRSGTLGFKAAGSDRPVMAEVAAIPAAAQGAASAAPAATTADALARVVATALGIAALPDRDNAGLGMTPGWDSLKQIDIILSAEQAFNTAFSAEEIGHLHSFVTICRALEGKIGAPA